MKCCVYIRRTAGASESLRGLEGVREPQQTVRRFHVDARVGAPSLFLLAIFHIPACQPLRCPVPQWTPGLGLTLLIGFWLTDFLNVRTFRECIEGSLQSSVFPAVARQGHLGKTSLVR